LNVERCLEREKNKLLGFNMQIKKLIKPAQSSTQIKHKNLIEHA